MGMKPKPQDHQQTLNCPRCHSSNTKFCYYNNYSLSQPRHFCKACKRYWTRGGTLRSVPVGGGCRKNKRIKQSSFSFAPKPKPPTTSSAIPNFHSPNETAPFSSYDFYQSQFNEVMTSATSFVNFSVASSIEPENLILGGLPETNATNSFQSMFPFLPTPVKIGEENDLMQNKPDNGDPCMDQFSSVDSSGYWNSMGAWPDFSGYGSSVTSLI